MPIGRRAKPIVESGGVPVYFYDDFTGSPSGTLVTAHYPNDGAGPWTTVGQHADVSDILATAGIGQCMRPTGAGTGTGARTFCLTQETHFGDNILITGQWSHNGSETYAGSPAFVFNYQDTSNFWVVHRNITIGPRYLNLSKVVGGTMTTVVQYAIGYALAANIPRSVKISVQDDNVSVEFIYNGVSDGTVIDYTDAGRPLKDVVGPVGVSSIDTTLTQYAYVPYCQSLEIETIT